MKATSTFYLNHELCLKCSYVRTSTVLFYCNCHYVTRLSPMIMLLGGGVQFLSKNKIKLMQGGIVGDMNFISTAFCQANWRLKVGMEGRWKCVRTQNEDISCTLKITSGKRLHVDRFLHFNVLPTLVCLGTCWQQHQKWSLHSIFFKDAGALSNHLIFDI